MSRKYSERVYNDDDLYPVLKRARKDDRRLLAELLNKKISAADDVMRARPTTLTDELQRMGGHSAVNFFRGGGVTYKEIVRDVAKRVKAKINPDDPIEDQEWAIVERLFEKAKKKMPEEDRQEFEEHLRQLAQEEAIAESARATRSTSAILSQLPLLMRGPILNMISTQVAAQIGIRTSASFVARRASFGWLGPLGWALGGVLLMHDIAGPAYTVTIPGVLFVATFRANQHSEDVATELGDGLDIPPQPVPAEGEGREWEDFVGHIEGDVAGFQNRHQGATAEVQQLSLAVLGTALAEGASLHADGGLVRMHLEAGGQTVECATLRILQGGRSLRVYPRRGYVDNFPEHAALFPEHQAKNPDVCHGRFTPTPDTVVGLCADLCLAVQRSSEMLD